MKQKGITLIALVITIIVLLILAGVSITTIVGDDGIIGKAMKAREVTKISELQEYVDIWINNNKLDGNIKTESDLINELVSKDMITNDDKKQWEETGELIINDTKINILISASDNSNNDNNNNNNNNNDENNVQTLSNVEVGDYIEYFPDVATETEINQVNSYITTYSGKSSNTTVAQVTDLKWRVMEVSEDTITLISEGSAPKFYLYGPTGYSNGVKLLNTVCSILYDNTEIGATARNLNREDLEPYISRNTKTLLGRTYDPYTGSKYYPNIYPLEYSYSTTKKNQIDGVDTTGTLKRSEQPDWIDAGYTGATTSIRPVTSSLTSFIDLTEDNHIFKDDIYYEIFLKDTNLFWLSTREYIATSTNYTLWCMPYANSTCVSGVSLMDVHTGGSAECEIRPIVFLDISLECLDGDGSYENPYVIFE